MFVQLFLFQEKVRMNCKEVLLWESCSSGRKVKYLNYSEYENKERAQKLGDWARKQRNLKKDAIFIAPPRQVGESYRDGMGKASSAWQWFSIQSTVQWNKMFDISMYIGSKSSLYNIFMQRRKLECVVNPQQTNHHI